MFPESREVAHNHNPVGRVSPKQKDTMKNRQIDPLFLPPAPGIRLVGCKTNPYGVTKLPKDGSGNTSANTANDLGPGSGKTTDGTLPDGKTTEIAESNNHQGWTQNREALAANTVHFDYDKSSIRSNEQKNVAAVADYLKANSEKAVLVEGHCDERGTDEYNRALGVRRAGAIRDELVRLGIGS